MEKDILILDKYFNAIKTYQTNWDLCIYIADYYKFIENQKNTLIVIQDILTEWRVSQNKIEKCYKKLYQLSIGVAQIVFTEISKNKIKDKDIHKSILEIKSLPSNYKGNRADYVRLRNELSNIKFLLYKNYEKVVSEITKQQKSQSDEFLKHLENLYKFQEEYEEKLDVWIWPAYADLKNFDFAINHKNVTELELKNTTFLTEPIWFYEINQIRKGKKLFKPKFFIKNQIIQKITRLHNYICKNLANKNKYSEKTINTKNNIKINVKSNVFASNYPIVEFNFNTGLGYCDDRKFRLGVGKPEFIIFNNLYKNIGICSTREEIQTLVKNKYSGQSYSYFINEIAKKLRKKLGIGNEFLILNNGSITLMANKKYPSFYPILP